MIEFAMQSAEIELTHQAKLMEFTWLLRDLREFGMELRELSAGHSWLEVVSYVVY